ncbi:MAG: hypothetical protein KKF50_04815 [Nanoarchaeota archaeon]|nr:hypothetical protein [Nanoarchaeota archaeon]
MEHREHIQSSRKVAYSLEFSRLDFSEVEMVIKQVNRWMDYFFGRSGEVDGRQYDYSDCSQNHRREIHHFSGIIWAGDHISKLYGVRYRSLAERMAEQHILDDFGKIPDRRDFW